jgi:SAM-dependent methyltransferase
MADRAPTGPLARARALLDEADKPAAAAGASRRVRGAQPAASVAPAGYLDLLEGRPVASTGRAQDLMLSRLVPRIYEWPWRPALGRVAKGPLGPSMEGELRLARELLRLGPGATVLDVACGTGNFTRELARSVGPDGLAVGIDVSETMLARAVERIQAAGLANAAYVRGDAEALPFAPESFDAVCCFAALHLFSDPGRALDRIGAVLRPGGRVAILTSARRAPRPLRPAESVLGAVTGMRMFELDEVVAELRARGFEELERRLAGVTQLVAGRRA